MKRFYIALVVLLLIAAVPCSVFAKLDCRNKQGNGDLEADGGFYIGYTFATPDVQASVDADLFVPMLVTNTTATTGRMTWPNKIPLTRDGSVIGVSIICIDLNGDETTPTTGMATADVEINGTSTGLTATWSYLRASGEDYETQDKDLDTFSAGDYLSVNLTTDSAWSPTTNDLVVRVETEQ